jgi:hypothetical protein
MGPSEASLQDTFTAMPVLYKGGDSPEIIFGINNSFVLKI